MCPCACHFFISLLPQSGLIPGVMQGHKKVTLKGGHEGTEHINLGPLIPWFYTFLVLFELSTQGQRAIQIFLD